MFPKPLTYKEVLRLQTDRDNLKRRANEARFNNDMESYKKYMLCVQSLNIHLGETC